MKLPVARASLLASLALVPVCAGAQPSPATALVVESEDGRHRAITEGDLDRLPAIRLTIPAEPGRTPPEHVFEGPLLWTVLHESGAIDDSQVRGQVRQTVLVTGRDGYTAVLALAEISPAFAGKQVIVATRMDGQPLSSAHLRLAVPDERRAGRSVRDLASFEISSAPTKRPMPGSVPASNPGGR